MEVQEYFVSKKKAKKSIIIVSFILIGIIGWWSFLNFSSGFSWFNTIFFGIIFLVFLIPIFMMLAKMNNKIPSIVISDEGVIEALSGVKDHVHTWDTIEKVGRKKIFGRLYILVFIKDPYQFIESQSGRMKKRLNQMYGQAGTPVAFPVEFIDGDADVIYNQIRAKVREHRGEEASEETED
jgi:hypothetical protein